MQDILAIDVHLASAVGERAQGFHLGLQFCEAEMHALVVDQRHTKNVPFPRVLDGLIDDML